jgi:hypothetical protein
VPIASTKNLIFINKVLKNYSLKNWGKIKPSPHSTGGRVGGEGVGYPQVVHRLTHRLTHTHLSIGYPHTYPQARAWE